MRLTDCPFLFLFPSVRLRHSATSSVEEEVSVPDEASKPTDFAHHLQVMSKDSDWAWMTPRTQFFRNPAQGSYSIVPTDGACEYLFLQMTTRKNPGWSEARSSEQNAFGFSPNFLVRSVVHACCFSFEIFRAIALCSAESSSSSRCSSKGRSTCDRSAVGWLSASEYFRELRSLMEREIPCPSICRARKKSANSPRKSDSANGPSASFVPYNLDDIPLNLGKFVARNSLFPFTLLRRPSCQEILVLCREALH